MLVDPMPDRDRPAELAMRCQLPSRGKLLYYQPKSKMPPSSDTDGTPDRRRRNGSRGRARVSITTTDNSTNHTNNHTNNHTTAPTPSSNGHEADPASTGAALTPASSDLRQVRTVRTGGTAVPTGARGRGGGAGGGYGDNSDNSANASGGTAHLTGGLGSPNSASTGTDVHAVPTTQQRQQGGGDVLVDAVVGPSPSYQSMGAGTQATATAGGLLYSALGTIKEWTNDIANDLMVAAVDHSNNSNNSNDANANGPSSGNRTMEGGGSNGDGNQVHNANDDNNNNNNNNTHDKKKSSSSSPGRKLRAAVVRSLSPGSSRRGKAKNNIQQRRQQQQQQQSLRVTGTNPCVPALRQVMDDFVQATTAMEGDANNNNTTNTNNTNKPMSKMRQKLAKSTPKGGTRNKSNNKATSISSSSSPGRKNACSLNGSELLGMHVQQGHSADGRGVGGGDSTVVARTNPRNDNNATNEKNKKTRGGGQATTNATGPEAKPQIIGPVQFLQHMMSTNCMAGADLAELGFGAGGDSDDDDDDDDDGSSYEDSSSEDGSEYSDTTGHTSSSGRNRRQRSSGGRRRAQQQQQQRRRSGSGSRRGGGSRGRGRGRRGSSTLSGRPEDIPEGDEDEDSSTVTGIEEDLDVIGRRPGVGVVRDKKGGGTPRQHNRKSVSAHAGSGDVSDLRHFTKQIIDQGFPLIWHRVHDSKLQMEPTDITTFLMLDEESPDPCLTWDIYDDDANGRSRKVTARGSIPLFEIASVEKAEAKHLQAYPFAMPSHSFFVTLSNGGVILFEAKDKDQKEVFVRGIRWVVARLSFNLIVGNGSICTELGLIGRDAFDDEDVDSTMDDVTNRLVDVSVQAVRANSMMKA